MSAEHAVEMLLYGLSLIATVVVLGRILSWAPYGFDFTDEGFHLVSMASPFLYDRTASQFGFVYHPLHLLLDGDIAALRRANVLITFGVGWLLTGVVLHRVLPPAERGALRPMIRSAGFAAASLVMFMTWITGPSYNMLAFAGLSIATAGLLLAEAPSPRTGPLGAVLLGLGGWLAFMAKPTTALALAVCVGAYVGLVRRFRLRDLMLAAGTALVLLIAGAIAIDGSVVGFVDRLQNGYVLLRTLAAGHSFERLLRSDRFAATPYEWTLFAVATIALVVTGRLAFADSRPVRVAGLSLAAVLFLMAFVLALAPLAIRREPGLFQTLVLCAVPVAALLVAASTPGQSLHRVPARDWLLVVLLLALPYCFAFGTNNNYWARAGHAGLLWVLAGLVVLAPLARARGSLRSLLPFVLAVQAFAALQVQSGIDFPRRQPRPLGADAVSVALGGHGSTLMLDRGVAGYIAAARAAAAQAGFRPGTPMLDLSGLSPGLLHALQARSIGQAWMIGGLRGSLDLSRLALRRVSCAEIAVAWLLDEPSGHRRLPPQLLESVGASRDADYVLVARLQTPPRTGESLRPRLQELLRPVRDPATAMRACEEAGRSATR